MMKRILLLLVLFSALGCSSKVYHVAEVNDRYYRMNQSDYAVDPEVVEMVMPYKKQLEATMNEVIAYNESDLIKGKPSSTLTNWFADVVFDGAQKLVTEPLDFAAQNYGGIRIPSIGKGDVTVGTIYELMPFDNIVYILELKGDVVQEFCNGMAKSGGWPMSKNLYYELHYGEAKNIKIKGEPLDLNKTYNVVLPDYVARGGDNMEFFSSSVIHDTGVFIRDLIITELKYKTSQGMNIVPDNEPRID